MDPTQPKLLSLLSHEFRSPLGVIRGYLRLLEQTGAELSDQHRQAVTGALKATDHAADLLAQVSLLAQLQRGETTFDFKPAKLGNLLVSAVEAVQLPNEPVVQLVVGDVAAVEIDADDALLRGALTTLMTVVVRAQAQDTVLRVTAHHETRVDRDGVTVAITAAPSLSALTEGTINLSRGGIGLDLPIAESLVAAHRGQLRELRQGDRYAGVIVWLPASS